MWWLIGIGLWFAAFVVVLALCGAAGEADERQSKLLKRTAAPQAEPVEQEIVFWP